MLLSKANVSVEELPALDHLVLHQNVPNPFNPATVIQYDVPPGGAGVSIVIYDVEGRFVRTLVKGDQTAGSKTVTWNGQDERGEKAASGVYFCKMSASGFEKTKKMVLLK